MDLATWEFRGSALRTLCPKERISLGYELEMHRRGEPSGTRKKQRNAISPGTLAEMIRCAGGGPPPRKSQATLEGHPGGRPGRAQPGTQVAGHLQLQEKQGVLALAFTRSPGCPGPGSLGGAARSRRHAPTVVPALPGPVWPFKADRARPRVRDARGGEEGAVTWAGGRATPLGAPAGSRHHRPCPSPAPQPGGLCQVRPRQVRPHRPRSLPLPLPGPGGHLSPSPFPSDRCPGGLARARLRHSSACRAWVLGRCALHSQPCPRPGPVWHRHAQAGVTGGV